MLPTGKTTLNLSTEIMSKSPQKRKFLTKKPFEKVKRKKMSTIGERKEKKKVKSKL